MIKTIQTLIQWVGECVAFSGKCILWIRLFEISEVVHWKWNHKKIRWKYKPRLKDFWLGKNDIKCKIDKKEITKGKLPSVCPDV